MCNFACLRVCPPSYLANSRRRTETPEEGADDRSSIGESSKARARKTESERRQFLEEDPSSGDVEAHKVFCKACDSWVELNPKRRYIMRLWLEHKKQCKNTAAERCGYWMDILNVIGSD